MLLTFIKNILFYKKRTYHYFFIYWVKACLYITIGWTPSRDVLIGWKVKQVIYQHWCSTKHDALSQSRNSWAIIILRLAQKWNCLTLAHNETILSSLSFYLCWGLFSSNRFYPSASFLLCFLPHSLTRKKGWFVEFISIETRHLSLNWVSSELWFGDDSSFCCFKFMLYRQCFNDRLFAADNRTLAKFERSGVVYRSKVFRDLYLWPPRYFHQTEFRPWSNLNTRLFESSSLHWKKKSKDKNNKKTKNKTDVNPYRIFWSQWQFILFLS